VNDAVLTPVWRGAGYIQVQLMDDVRIQVYHPDYPSRRRYPSIHSHYHPFTSRTLAGRICSSVYQYQLVSKGSHMLVKRNPDRGLSPDVVIGRTDLKYMYTIDTVSGVTYEFGGPRLMHEVAPVQELTVTCLRHSRVDVTTEKRGCIYAMPPDADLLDRVISNDEGPDEDTMRDIVREALRGLV